jgi:hypothetical protein
MKIIHAWITTLLWLLAQHIGDTLRDHTLQPSSGLSTCTGLDIEMARAYTRTELLVIGKEVLERKKIVPVPFLVYKTLQDYDICSALPTRREK